MDSAASQVRDLPLAPKKDNLLLIGGGIANLLQVLQTLEQEAPHLATPQEAQSEQAREANQRLGKALILAEDLSEGGDLQGAQTLLEQFAAAEPSLHHSDIATLEAIRYKLRRTEQ
jgi:hypothetical protein